MNGETRLAVAGGLAAETDRFGGVIVDPESIASDPAEFDTQLEQAIGTWRTDGVRLCWLRLPIQLAAHVPVAVSRGFRYHHADREALQLTLAVNPGAHIPLYATHYIGAGGVVLRDDDHLLVVSERHRRRGQGRHYKLPGGALKPGEHIITAVQREVLEETGVETRFRSLVCFRHWHGYRHGKSDIYFICRLDALSTAIRHDPQEIEECRWMPVQDYLAHEEASVFNKRIVRAALSGRGIVPEVIEGYGTPETHEFFMPPGET
jgi:8-oxo-dGTP pyrophosphatase MutT (NUDIX family)